ncbi:hypothetical protein WMY93_000036 [Mugilogobius chulae]|uniref:Vacuolar protein sorting 13 homolog C n=1 Tax=Mugilogobius chulae TaxID=88201 RepID=A0AAW0PZQ8_9GOBI
MFESLVSDLLNRFIGDYVENLDKSQLKIGIWGGNVVLENLKVKENALSEFDVPFRIKAGQIGKLTLKIPWKNLYSEAVVATLEGLYLLVVPGATIKYDAAKEEKYQQELKQKELQRIEDALQMAARRASQTGDMVFNLETVVYKDPQHVSKGHKKLKKHKKCLKKLRRHDHNADKSQDQKKDTFTEKLATQVIKNLQVKISNIHLRYEDDVSDPERPLSMGVTLSELSLQTTDENWKACILNEAAKIIYKLGSLECLCAYWNVPSLMFYKGSWEDIIELLKSGISTKTKEQPYNIFKPIFASAKVCINPNAEVELKTPKAHLQLEVQNIAIEMNKPQYLAMVDVLESIDAMVKNAPYRKFRPDVPVHTNAAVWWKYALSCIMEVHVRRRRKMWSWSSIKQHRETLKSYKNAFKTKLLNQGKTTTDTELNIQDLERILDVFNITLVRQQAKMEVIRSGQKLVAKKSSGQKQSGGWFGGWFGKKAKKDEQEQEESKETEGSGLDDIMTAEEKQKLYTAIGYSGSSHNLTLPKEYVAVSVQFQLLKTSVTIREKPDVPEILKVQIINLSTKISQRPGAQAIRLEASLQHWYVTGLQQQGAVPSLITSMGDSSSSLLSVVFEINPEESTADQLFRVNSQPVEIITTRLTVNSIADFFKTGKGVDLEVLTSATLSKLEEIKEKTATVLDLKIDLKPSYLLLPKSGFYSNTSDLIIVDFGSLKLNSVEQSVLSPSPSSSLEEIMDRAYERFTVQLRKVQVLYSKSGEEWRAARQQSGSVQHILQPMDFSLQLAKCMVDNDARMPKFKVSGELPLLHVKISDLKIQNLFDLVDSIPLPNMGSAPSTPTEKILSLAESRPRALNLQRAILPTIETDSDEDVSEKSLDEEHQVVSEELTEVQFKFEVKEVILELTQQADQEKTVLLLSVCQLGTEGRKRSYDLSAVAYLNRITLDYCDVPAGKNPLHLIRSSEQHGCNLLKVEYTKADPCGPSFQTEFANTEQTLKVNFSALDFLLHTKALLSTVNFMHNATPPKLRESQERDPKKQVDKTAQGKTVSKGAKDSDIFNFKLFAVLGCFHVEVCDDLRSIADIRIQGINASVTVQPKETQVSARLMDIVVTDISPDTVHRKAVSMIKGEEVFSFKLSLYPDATQGDGYSDMSKVDGKVTLRLGCIQIIYLHKFLMSMLMFIDNFQTAKEALSQATVQAAEKAASSVRDFAQKSFRLSMDIRLKAPLIIIPRTPTPTILTQKQTVPDCQMLQPISFELLVTRNLCSSWFYKIPTIQVKGVLHSLNMSFGEDDLSLLMKILVHNIGEGSKVQRNLTQEKAPDAPEQQQASLAWSPSSELTAGQQAELENVVNVLLKFEIKEVMLTLKKPKDHVETPFLVLHVAQLGIDTKVRKYDTCATVYIREITMNCLEFKDMNGDDLCIIRSSAETGAELLKVQYFMADRNGPNFSTIYKNTEQMITVVFTSLDLVLHTEALLSSMNFLSAVMTPTSSASAEKETRSKPEDKTVSTKSTALVSPVDNVIDIKLLATLGAFNVLVCDQKSNMADIKIQGLNGTLLLQGPQTHISARLRDFIVLNVDPKCIHKKAISIVGDEVFNFNMMLTPNATEGASYADTSKSDGKVRLNVGCVQVVYLHKFIMSLLNFTNNFQTAKEALSQATVQAAEKAASSVRDFAQKSFRLSMDIRLKAPLIIIPQDSNSHDALVMDLGLITVGNSFSLQQVEGCPLPAVIDNMDVQLSQLKLFRTSVGLESDGPSVELLEAVNLQLKVKRNLAPAWNKKMAAVEIEGDMKPMKVELSQSDLKVLLRILTETWARPTARRAVSPNKRPASSSERPPQKTFSFNIDSLGLVLFNNDPNKFNTLLHTRLSCPGPAMRLRAVIIDPEVVFVASLMKADAPALVSTAEGGQNMTANLRDLKVLACPFIRGKEDTAVTTVLRPCSVLLKTETHPKKPLCGSVTVEEVIVKISPVTLNTVMTITSAMTSVTPQDPLKQEPKATCQICGVDQATEVTESFKESDGTNEGEKFSAEIKVVQVTVESGLGHRTVPLLLAESSFSGQAQNWSSLLHLTGDMTLEVNYFNETHAVWEPLIERVDSGSRRWNLALEMKNNPVQDRSPVHGNDFVILPEPRTAVLSNLGKELSEGTASTFDYTLKEKPPFTIRNALGIPLIIQHSNNLRPVQSAQQGKLLEVSVDQSMDLDYSTTPLSRGKLSALQRQESCLFNLSIVPSGFSEMSNISVDRPGRRLYNIRGPMLQEAVSVLLQIDAAEGNKVITVRAPLQIRNHFSVPFTILRYCPASRDLQPLGQAEPEKEFHIPLEAYRSQLFVRPAGNLEQQYGPSLSCVSWKEQVHRSSEVSSQLQCPSAVNGMLPLMLNTVAIPDELRHIANHGEQDWDPAYVLHLHPVATLRNLLPYTVRYLLESSADSFDLPEGSTSDLLNARIAGEVMSLVMRRYQGRDWHGHLRITPDLPEFQSVCLVCDSDPNMSVDVGLHVSRSSGRLLLSLFSPYWIINKTSRVLQYRAEDVSVKHPADFRDIILFSFKKKVFSNSKLQLRISTSSWSEPFSLGTVGSYGCVRCPANNMDFLVGVGIQMSSFNLTRIVSMSPFFTLVNKTSYELEVGEIVSSSSLRWHYMSAAELREICPPVCSVLAGENVGQLCVRVVGSDTASRPFFFNKQDSGTLLKMDTCGGTIVEINIANYSTVISFSDYYEGSAPALIINHTTRAHISYRQSDSAVEHKLRPGDAKRFVWDDPASTRTLRWSHNGNSGELNLLKDEVGQFSFDSLCQIHWVSFLDGRQRVLLFTEDVAVVTKARQAEELEQFEQEVKISLQNLGLSLVNNSTRQEIAYIGILSSGVVWEMKPKNRWKPFSQKNINLLEKTYQSQLNTKSEAGWIKLEGNLEVNLSGTNMAMRQPEKCPIRRNFLSGIQVEFKKSQHQRSLRAQLHWLQVDNQLPGAIFPIVFHPVPPPKSIALDSEPKPFIDVSIITRFNEHSNVMQFKYFMALVQEMAVKVDQGFLYAMLALFTPAADPQADKQKLKLIEKDLQMLQPEVTEASLTDNTRLSFFEHCHISPIKLHLSLSLEPPSDDDSSQELAAVQALNLLLKSIGATLTDVDDIIFKLGFFEVKYQFYSRDKLMWEVINHYRDQFLKQMYVLVLGLDVLGNPFGLIRGLSEGVEAFFYEPFQGAVQGPEEFAEGFVIGMRSLLGHTVGGAAGMVSKITGSMGKGLAAITMDKEYQQKRREEMNRPPKDFGESLAKGGKGLLKGFVGGVTGIVTKPVEGAKKEGAAGFFKGIGKGLVGAVARPTGGIVDMASSTFQGIQRAAESTEEVTKIRPVRLIREDGIIRPYDLSESQGYDLFQRSEIKQLEGEVFRDMSPHPGHRKTNIIVTNRRVLCVKELDFVNHFNKEWECLYENFFRPPEVQGTDLRIYCKEPMKLKLPKKDGQDPARTVHLKDAQVALKLYESICDGQTAQQQHRMSRQKSTRFLRPGNQH